MYRELDPQHIIDTMERLERRIQERFPHSNLREVARELVTLSHEAADISLWLGRPNLWVRGAVGLCALLLLVIFVAVLFSVDWRIAFFSSLAELFQGLDAAINDVVFLGAAIYFLSQWECRIKRRRALKALHQLRSVAHIIDMHQLPKDPEQYSSGKMPTPSSPVRTLTPYELSRYLDYCSEMLSVLSKLAAVYVQHFNAPPTLSAVNDLEDLTNGLARKIWQKISIIDRLEHPTSPDTHTSHAVTTTASDSPLPRHPANEILS